MTCQDRLESISISSMPSTGASAPLQPFGALALAAAEVIGSAIATHELTGKPAYFRVEIYPFDLRAESMVFGTPENVRFQMLSHDMNRFYGWPWTPAPNNIHVMAKRPDGQSAAEKAAIMVLGASLGATHFSGAGTLSLDEIFSPEQLVLDCEIRDWVANVTKGASLGTYEVDGGSLDGWLSEIRRGIDRGFMALDSTLDYYRSHTWFPGRFERRAIGPWLADGQPRLPDRLRDEVRRRIARHDYELDADRRDALDRIYESARSALDS
jgi:trimethylamine:corrinoid methyltransferase-like protein